MGNSEIIKEENSFALKILNFNNKINNYCINTRIDGCIKLEDNHEYVQVAQKLNVGETTSIIYRNSKLEIQLLYKGRNILSYDKNIRLIKKGYNNLILNISNTKLNNLKKELINNLYKYNELGFIHETSIQNIKGIYEKQGIYSRNYLCINNESFCDIAEHEVLKRTKNEIKNCSRFYLRPKTPAHYKFKTSDETCIFICDYNIIFDKNSEIYLIDKIVTNANIYNLNSEYQINYAIRNLKYDKIFEMRYVDEHSDKSAEFLCENYVELKYIKAIVFRNIYLCYEFIDKYPNWNIDVLCIPEFFER